ncbi:hypothetical protein CDCA_CDCA01G0109 [Cyanidium caldarium]|uniref:S1 motif domain-containing protein n=1 Tax=Cyanidium caldarium TaxID=2771 RepID=A0AAV9IPB1_CYACA|nr:hypothetical protein CDCA_CDCA01G0109 [Cyanidium caldarium]
MGDSAPGRFGERRDGLRSRRPPMKLRRRPLQYNLTDLREGQKLEGTVVSVVPYGAFVDCGAFYTDQMDEADAPPASPAAAAANGASDDAVAAERGGSESAQAPTPFDGLVHIRDFSYDFVLSPHNMVSLGDNVTVYVKYADIANHKLALSFLPPIDAPPSEKGLTPSSRDLYAVSETPDGRRNYEYADADKRRAVGSFNLDDEVRGVVRRVTNFGAFLDVGAEVDAFLHVSDMWGRQPRRTLEFLKIGQVVRARVCEVNQTMRRLRLRALTSTDEQ